MKLSILITLILVIFFRLTAFAYHRDLSPMQTESLSSIGMSEQGPDPVESLSGSYEYVGYEYEGVRYEKPNPALHVVFNFTSNTLLSLTWVRDGENSFCHRISEYKYSNRILSQKIIWVDPKNTIECSQDSDMQLGRVSENRLEINSQELRLYLELNGKDFIYLLKPYQGEI